MEWAVDPTTKLPIDVSNKTFHYVRVYSAVLDNATFGETSTEVCGIFTTANGQKTAEGVAIDVGRTDMPTILLDEIDVLEYGPEVLTYGDVTMGGISAGTPITVTAAEGSHTYINSSSTGSYTTVEENQTVRIIVQSEEKAPRIVIIK